MTINDLNFAYYDANGPYRPEYVLGGYHLECGTGWTIAALEDYMPGYDLETINLVKALLCNSLEIKKASYLHIWDAVCPEPELTLHKDLL